MNSPAENLKVYATYPHDCSYIAGRQATTVFIDPEARVTQALYSRLSEHGFRRSGAHIYKPHCKQCKACIACRLPLATFAPNRTQRKLLNRNRDLELLPLGNIDNDTANIANYDSGAVWNGQPEGNVTTVGSGGAGSASSYGAFDMAGNLWEWNERIIFGNRGLRGGPFGADNFGLRSSERGIGNPATDSDIIGFRVAGH